LSRAVESLDCGCIAAFFFLDEQAFSPGSLLLSLLPANSLRLRLPGCHCLVHPPRMKEVVYIPLSSPGTIARVFCVPLIFFVFSCFPSSETLREWFLFFRALPILQGTGIPPIVPAIVGPGRSRKARTTGVKGDSFLRDRRGRFPS